MKPNNTKVAIVTGGTKGIGKEIVKTLLRSGYYVFTNYANDDYSAQVAKSEFQTISPQVEVIKSNQSNRHEFKQFIDYIISKTSIINVIVCNAGKTTRTRLFNIKDEDWDMVMEICVNSHLHLIRDTYKHIVPNSRIIFIGSLLGIYPHSMSIAYGVAKSAIHAFAKNLVKEFEGTGTTVNVIAPGFVDTEWQSTKPQHIKDSIISKTAIKRFATTEEIATCVDFILGNDFINGCILDINGGYSYR